MKKIYLLFLTLFISCGAFAQIKPYIATSVGYKTDTESFIKSGKTKNNNFLKNGVSPDQIKVAIISAPGDRSWNDDIKDKLLSTGMFSSVDLFHYYLDGMPTIGQIIDYEAILTFSDYTGDQTALGNLLAEYINQGGSVVNAVFNTASIGLGGNFVTSDYELIIPSWQTQGTEEHIGTIYIANHPILNGVTSFSGGSSSYRSSNATVKQGATIVAEWTDGQPLIVTKENVGPKNVRRADLNFYPPSSDSRGDFWDATTDGDLLLANALVWVSGKSLSNQNVVCNPININLDEDGKYKLDSLDMIELTSITPDSLMTFDDMKIFAYPDTFTTANIEWPVFVRVTAYDKNYIKSRCWAMVTVHDAMPPTVVGNDVEIFLDSDGMAVVTKEQLTDSATFDVSGIVSTSIDKDTFTCANIGENWVILSATDIYGNVGTDSVLVTVNSGMPALDSIPDVNITVVAGVCETAVEYPFPVINEICGISATQTAGLGREGLFPVGTTTETWMVINCKGDTTEVTFDVTVTAPNAFPALDVIADITADEDAPEISIPVTGITYGNDCQTQTVTVVAETDNTELVDSVAVVYNDGDTAGLVKLTLVPDMSGTAKITVTVTDSEGATMFRSFTLVVNEVADTIANKEGLLATAVWTKEIETGINMYPNPTQDMVTIDIRNYSASQTEVAVFTLTGSEIIRKTYPAGETIRFSMNEQVSGVYLVKMNIDGNHMIKKLVVDKK